MPLKLLSTLVIAATITGVTLAAEVKLPANVKVKPGRLVRVEASTDGKFPIKWVNLNEDVDLIPDSSGKYAIALGVKPGRFKLAAYTSDEKGPSEPAICVLEVEGSVPPSPPPPGPGPTPPSPPAPSDEAPIKVPGFRVMLIYESEDLTKMPASQQLILYSKEVRDYLKAKCVENEVKTGEYYILDKDADVSSLPKYIQEAFARPKKSIPWMLISDGKTGYEGPLPANVTDTLKLLKKYGGE